MATLPVTDPLSGADSAVLPSFPAPRAVVITLAGMATAKDMTPGGGTHESGPRGWNGCRQLAVGVRYGTTTYFPFGCGGSGPDATSAYGDTVVVSGAGIARRSKGQQALCGTIVGAQYSCWQYSGQHTVTVTVFDPAVSLKAQPSEIAAPSNVQFTYSHNAPTNTPKRVLGWRFESRSGASDSVYGPNHSSWFYIRESGTMHIEVEVNGIQKTASTDVVIGKAELTVTAEPSRVIVGKRVDFTAAAWPNATANGAPRGFTVSSWRWLPDSGNAATVCPGGGTSCSILVYSSGRMQAIGTVGGQADTAAATVEAFPCDTTGIEGLDDLSR